MATDIVTNSSSLSSSFLNRDDFYRSLLSSARSLLAPTTDSTASMANLAALIYHSLRHTFGDEAVNWCGFYLVKNVRYQQEDQDGEERRDQQGEHEQVLVLGPFQGESAVSLIFPGAGVCGTCLIKRCIQLVPDVHKHPNHIVCDERSQSEIVVPIYSDPSDSTIVGLLDVDSPLINGFNESDSRGLLLLTRLLGKHVQWTNQHTVVLQKRVDPLDLTCPSNRLH